MMMLFEKSTEFIEILETVEKYKDDLIGLNDEEKRILNLAFDILSKVHKSNQEYNLNEILYAENAERVSGMLSDWYADAKNYEKNLTKKAKIEEREEMAKEMLLDGEPISKIMKYTKLTEEKIKKIEKTLK